MYGPKKMQEGGIASMIAPTGVQNQMVGQPQRMPSGVPGYDAGYAQAPGQPRLPAEPYPIGRPTGVVGGPAYYTPPGFQAPPQPTEAFMPTDVRPDPIGQQFMRQYQSPMGQQFIDQYEATQAPIRAREAELREAERARQDQRFQEMMDRIAELEGQLTAREEAATIPQPDIPVFDPGNPLGIDLSGLPDFSQIDFSGIPDFLKNLNIPGITDRPMEGTGREEEPMDRFDPRDTRFAIDSVTGEVIPEEEAILRAMPFDDGGLYPGGSPGLYEPGGKFGPGQELPSPTEKNITFTPDQRLRPGGLPPKTLPTPVSRTVTQVPSLMARRDIIEPMPLNRSAPAGGTLPVSRTVTQVPSLMARNTDVTNGAPGEGVTTDRIPEGMRFMGQPLIPTSTPPRKGSFLSAVAIPDLPPPISRSITQVPSLMARTPNIPMPRPAMLSPRPSMQNIPRINLSKLGIR